MGVVSGTMTLTRYRLVAASPGQKALPGIQKLNELFEPFRAKRIRLDHLEKNREEIIGWDRPMGAIEAGLDADKSEGEDNQGIPEHGWDLSHCQIGDGLLLRMRVEQRKVPSSLFQVLLKQRINSESKGKKRLPRIEKIQIKEELKSELTKRALPQLSFVDAFWKDRDGIIHLFTSSKKSRNLFESLFSKTFGDHFGLQLVPVEPPLLGLSKDDWQSPQRLNGKALDQLQAAIPMGFAPADSGRQEHSQSLGAKGQEMLQE